MLHDTKTLKILSSCGYIERELVEINGRKTVLYDGHRPIDYREVFTRDLFETLYDERTLALSFVREGQMTHCKARAHRDDASVGEGEASSTLFYEAAISAIAKALS